jgi:hypothetical protein
MVKEIKELVIKSTITFEDKQILKLTCMQKSKEKMTIN